MDDVDCALFPHAKVERMQAAEISVTILFKFQSTFSHEPFNPVIALYQGICAQKGQNNIDESGTLALCMPYFSQYVSATFPPR